MPYRSGRGSIKFSVLVFCVITVLREGEVGDVILMSIGHWVTLIATCFRNICLQFY